MTVKDFKTYLEFYKDEQEVVFKLPSGQSWVIDEAQMLAHNLKDQEKREECKLYLK
jgi:hypothetical protein